MRRYVTARLCLICTLMFLSPLALVHAQIVNTELAGNSLSQYPFFEYVRAVNVNAPMKIAIDPSRFSAIAGDTCDVYVVTSKTASQWIADPGLTDVTPGGSQSVTFSGTNIQANTVTITSAGDLSADAGTGLGVGYDIILDCDQDGNLSNGDYIDGRAGEAGIYIVHDITASGPLTPTVLDRPLGDTVATNFGIPAHRKAQHIFYPSNITAMGKLPIVIISHGNGHSYNWYNHIGRHLASYGYVVMSHDNNTGPGSTSAAQTTMRHTDAFIQEVEAGNIAGGALRGHIDSDRIVWIGHSRGAEGVAIAFDDLFENARSYRPTRYNKDSILLISSMLPTDFFGKDETNPHNVNFHLWTASGDDDVSGEADSDRLQTFHLHERATGFRMSTVVQGSGHGSFHNGSGGDVFIGPCGIGRAATHKILLGHLLALIKHYVEGNIPALDFLTRQYESFRPIGVSSTEPCIVVSHEYRNGSSNNAIIDNYESNSGLNLGSAGGSITFDVDNVTEGVLNDSNANFAWIASDPFNGATQAGPGDITRGVVFDWTNNDKFYEWAVPAGRRNFNNFRFLSFRGAQGTRHPNTLAETNDLTFTVTLRDGASTARTSTISIGAYGGGLEQPYGRDGGWHNEMETIQFRITDFLNNNSRLDLSNIVAVRLNVGPSHGSSRGRIVIDELMLSNHFPPRPFEILAPTTARPANAGTSVAGSRVLVRLFAGGYDVSPANLTVAVDGTNLTAAQIPTAAANVGGETWLVIAPGPKADGCYNLTVTLNTPSGISTAQSSSLCYADDESRAFDRVLAIDQTNSMRFDGGTGIASTEKMDAAKAAARFYVNLSNAGDQIGVVSFQRRDQNNDGSIIEPDELAERQFNLVLAGEGATDQRPNAHSAVQSVNPDTSPGFTGKETSPGAALVEARTMLNNDGMTGHKPNIVLLTDGLENYAPFWTNSGAHGSPLKPSFEAGDIRIDTIGIGSDADDALLADIAMATDGEFMNLNEGSGSFYLLSRLSSWYKSLDEDMRGEQRFFYKEGYPTPSFWKKGPGSGTTTSSGSSSGGSSATPPRGSSGSSISRLDPAVLRRKKFPIQRFIVEPNLDWMTVAFHANVDHAANIYLYEPGEITPVTPSPPTITYRNDAKHSVYRIRTPKAGEWCYLVMPKVADAEFFAVASAPTALSARFGPRRLQKLTTGGYAFPLRIWIADEDAVTGATVFGYLRRPDGVKVNINLKDNGGSIDGAANDGIYGLNVLANQPGSHFVNIEVSGTSNKGQPFKRYLQTAFYVPGQYKKPVQTGEGLPPNVPPTTGGGHCCRCEDKSRYTVAGFGGITLPMGRFDTIADPSLSLGLKPKVYFSRGGLKWSAGAYLGHDRFSNPGPGSDFTFTHLSPELEVFPWNKACPALAFHVGAGAYRNENGNTEFGYNLGASLSTCLTQRMSLVGRYDFRSVEEPSLDYSTLQIGLRFTF